MVINVAQLLKEPIGASRTYQINELISDKNADYVQGEVTLIRTSQSIFVKGAITASVKSVCSRCLNTFDCSVKFHLEDEFFPSINTSRGSPLPNKPERFTIDKNHIMDLSEAFNQYAMLAMPMKLLCRPDCPGINSSRADNLNQGCYPYSSQDFDQRWSKLTCSGKESKT